MQSDLVINDWLAIPRGEIQFSFARSGGPGGQNVNKVNTKAVLRWRPAESAALPPAVLQRLLARHAGRLTRDGDLVIASDTHREQGRNVGECLNRLRALITSAVARPKVRRPTKATRGSQERRLRAKRTTAAKKASRRAKPDEES
ncbi:Peptidyl-tRNA hydrolase ArfB [Botrimarina colliarenosi]|uniref:Peptidyl-tRNA hydrolase ArfB n=1 Tax=Botrimarina colliarenosi TaxID=2528001 RepID=A0A5C6A4K6_9BACT|nr:alternative ribosome rescue aminoacyl-tRNA hydrolase ArfB [Botrimarina colliarenosi]TWT94041.1 Peptidyl-tRNA hydrolase ArfB [Botrimarina colliarenosi]